MHAPDQKKGKNMSRNTQQWVGYLQATVGDAMTIQNGPRVADVGNVHSVRCDEKTGDAGARVFLFCGLLHLA